MPEITPARFHITKMLHCNSETTPRMIPDTQRPWAPLRGASKCGETEEKEKQKDVDPLK